MEGPDAEGPSDKPMDFSFYKQFWSLQEYFCNPTLCYEADHWSLLQKYTKSVIGAFISMKLDTVGSLPDSSGDDAGDDSGSGRSEEYCAKFLTSSKVSLHCWWLSVLRNLF